MDFYGTIGPACADVKLLQQMVEAAMTGMDAFVYAAGVDERVEFPAPVYDAYKRYNIDPVKVVTVYKA